MVITNNADFHAYLTNKGVPVTYLVQSPSYYIEDELVIVFTNDCHALATCGNAHQDRYKDEYKRECNKLLDWLECGEHVIMISNVIKLGTPYMEKYEDLQARYDKLNINKQVIHTRDIGSLVVPHRVQLRYKNVRPIDFDIVATDNIEDPMHYWSQWQGDELVYKRQQVHYLNTINATNDTEERRKLRYIPEYSLFSQLYKKLYL